MVETIAPRYYRFLQETLQQARQDALLDSEQEAQILRRYQVASTSFWQILLMVLAAALLGGGIILLLAHNWAELSRPVRAALSYLPLAISYAALLVAYRKRDNKAQAAREGAGLFHALALIAALALIGQTYHSGGDVWNLLKNTALLLLPVALLYPAQSSACAFVLFTAGLFMQSDLALSDWALAAASGVLLWRQRGLVLAWFVALFALLCVLRLLFECLEEVAGQAIYLLIPLYYVLGRSLFGQQYAHNPLASIGAIGILGLALFSAWDDMGLVDFSWRGTTSWLGIFAYAGLGLAIAAAVLVVQKKLRPEQAAFAALLPLMLFINYILTSGAEIPINPMGNKLLLLFSFFLGLCLAVVAERQQRWLKFNAALFLLCNALAAAFFDEAYSFMLRGIVFIIIGLILLGANIFLMKKRKAA